MKVNKVMSFESEGAGGLEMKRAKRVEQKRSEKRITKRDDK